MIRELVVNMLHLACVARLFVFCVFFFFGGGGGRAFLLSPVFLSLARPI